MSYELQFLIMVKTTLDLNRLVDSLKRALTDVGPVRSRSFDWSGNWVQVRNNQDYDESMIHDPEDGFLYYPYKIEVSPTGKNQSLEHQIEIARHLKTVLESLGCEAVICAGFEELL